MSDYLIGDVQGCYDALQRLLKSINFSLDKDRIFFLGDVVNRGKKSLEVLTFIKAHPDNISMVLGNHDFHLLACAFGQIKPKKKDTFNDIVHSKNATKLLEFLLQQPLIIDHNSALMVHAGIPPNWDKNTALKQSRLVQKHLKSENLGDFLTKMYHNQPDTWQADLSEMEQCRYTINALMRMRFCKANGQLEFAHKLNFNQAPNGYKAWFMHEKRLLKDTDIFFGHWSALNNVQQKHIFPMDHGCVWGGRLSAIRQSDLQIFSVDC
ncbi:MAG: symmetrical bis(5'-nucleosyl)-tetraphosphatase [Proteobacteria bacterium]|nr:symmetrical bis(5'-nucleosyl)-tetraphosphatase [Pseudomonadota bacterium]MCH9711784.1 symmetrical bis(5'-nucleosyl)-tetraphosphatase [Pseudomonadota bacterium]MCH9749701.1 symmetrical bis(5'-nucleosyl)-tetraphosphatase [Pseudomonadota bacterium]